MSHRYIVSDNDQPFASVHADSAEEAIKLACAKTTGHDLEDCTADQPSSPLASSDANGLYGPPEPDRVQAVHPPRGGAGVGPGIALWLNRAKLGV